MFMVFRGNAVHCYNFLQLKQCHFHGLCQYLAAIFRNSVLYTASWSTCKENISLNNSNMITKFSSRFGNHAVQQLWLLGTCVSTSVISNSRHSLSSLTSFCSSFSFLVFLVTVFICKNYCSLMDGIQLHPATQHMHASIIALLAAVSSSSKKQGLFHIISCCTICTVVISIFSSFWCETWNTDNGVADTWNTAQLNSMCCTSPCTKAHAYHAHAAAPFHVPQFSSYTI